MAACRWHRLVRDVVALTGHEPADPVTACIAPRAYRVVAEIDEDGHSIGIRTDVCTGHYREARDLPCFVREIRLRST